VVSQLQLASASRCPYSIKPPGEQFASSRFSSAGRAGHTSMRFRRRNLLAGTAIFLLGAASSRTSTIFDRPWAPNAGSPPVPATPGPWVFFTGAEGRALESIADRIIPPDPQTPGGKDSGCAVFVDRQLAGPYGRQDGLYTRPPFQPGAKNRSPQSEAGPAEQYRKSLAALDRVAESSVARSDDPTSLIRIVLRGARSVATPAEPTGPGMPSFGWQLDDVQVAAVITYIRNSWNSAASTVDADAVRKSRSSLAQRSD
jgi:hypothetical protein